MKFNRSFLNQTLLSLILLTSATLSTHAQVITDEVSLNSVFSRQGRVDFNAESKTLSNAATVTAVDRSNAAENKNLVFAGTIIAAADTAESSYDSENSDQGFLTKKTAKIEFILALLIIVGSLIISERVQQLQEQQQSDLNRDKVNSSIAKNTPEPKKTVEK